MSDMRKLINLVESVQRVDEAAPGLSEIGVPTELISYLMTEFSLKHTVQPVKVDKAPKASEIKGNGLLRRTRSGEWYTLIGITSGRSPAWYTIAPGEKRVRHDNLKAALKNFGSGPSEYWLVGPITDFRSRTKDSPDEFDTLAGGSEDILSYMNRTFLPKLKEQMGTVLDRIFSNLRRIPPDVDSLGRIMTSNIPRSARESLVKDANFLENLMNRGFTRETVEEFLRSQGRLSHGFGSYYDNQEAFKEELKKPLARQKLAKILTWHIRHVDQGLEEVLQNIAQSDR